MVLKSCLILVIAALCGSFLGALHEVGDSLAVFRSGLAALGLAFVPFLRVGLAFRVAILALPLAGLGSVIWHKIPHDPVGDITLYQKNMYFKNSDIPALSRDIVDAGPDFVTLQEVSIENEALLDALKPHYPAQHLCRYTRSSGLAVLSKTSFLEEPFCARALGLVGARVESGMGPVWIVSMHLAWPFPGNQADQMVRILPILEELEGPLVIGGDFNMVPWSSTLRRIAEVSRTNRADPARASFALRGLPLPIDHVFAPGGGFAEARPEFGSDHRGILAHIRIKGP